MNWRRLGSGVLVCALLAMGCSSTVAKADEISIVEFVEDGYQIRYPQLAEQPQFNERIKKAALAVKDLYQNATGNVNVEIRCEIKLKSHALLSVVYTGVGSVEQAAHPNLIFYSTNLDLKTGKFVRLRDVVPLDEKLVAEVRKAKYVPAGGEGNLALKTAVLAELKRMSDAELLDRLQKADGPAAENANAGDFPETFSYFTKDAVGVSLPVPHALGDHAEFEVPKQNLALRLPF